jgi:hypothetical protein
MVARRLAVVCLHGVVRLHGVLCLHEMVRA